MGLFAYTVSGHSVYLEGAVELICPDHLLISLPMPFRAVYREGAAELICSERFWAERLGMIGLKISFIHSPLFLFSALL